MRITASTCAGSTWRSAITRVARGRASPCGGRAAPRSADQVSRAIPGAVEFTKYADSKGVKVFYITNRASHEKNATIKNLFELGFPMADEAHVMTMEN